MKLPVCLVLGLAGLIASCSPYAEIPPTPPVQGVPTDPATGEGAAANAPTEERQEEAEASVDPPVEERIPERTEDPEPTSPAPRQGVQVAKPVPGKPGFVFSPFNNKIIDVKGIPSGTLVADPTYPRSEKKYFRVP